LFQNHLIKTGIKEMKLLLTAKAAKDHATAYMAAEATKVSITSVLRNDYTIYATLKNDGSNPELMAKAQAGIEKLGKSITDKGALKSFNALLNRESKKVHKEIGVEWPAVKVKDGEMLNVGKDRGDSASGDGEGEGSIQISEEQAQDILKGHISVLQKAYKETSDKVLANTLQFAIQNLK
jgi:hypothetical protein